MNGYKELYKIFKKNGGVDGGCMAALKSLDERERTVLHLAICENDYDFVEWLVAQGSNVNTQDYYSQSPLQTAVILSSVALVKLLLDSGADPNFQDKYGKTALHYSVQIEEPDTRDEVVTALINSDADKSKKDNLGDTPFETKWF